MLKVVRIMSKNVSRLVKAFEGFKEGLTSFSQPPEGMFGRLAIIESGNVKISSDDLDFEFTVEFDDNIEANEAEIIIYNLSKTTIEGFKFGAEITITAGYKGDTGLIFKGSINKVTTKESGVDKVTTIKAIDFKSGTGRDLTEKTYKENTKASYILKNLLSYTDYPIAVFSPRRDYTYKEEVAIDGYIMDEVKKYAEVCGISVYINNGNIYARHITEGDNINFTLNADTGLIESPEEFEEEITAEDYTDIVKGYNLKMILQHRMTTAAIINLVSKSVSGTFRVRSGKHIFNESESITEVVVING